MRNCLPWFSSPPDWVEQPPNTYFTSSTCGQLLLLKNQEHYDLSYSCCSTPLSSSTPLTVYTHDGWLQKLSLAKCDWAPGEILDNAGVRHCVVGDLIVVAVGYPLVPFDFQFAIADEQLETARSALASGGFQEVPQTHQRFFDRTATNESTTGWPGYRFLPNDADDWTTSIIIVPAKFWHLDLSRDAWSRDTFLFPNSPCRFPRRLVYFQRQQIRAGIVTPEEARALIPRPDLKLAAIKQKYRDRADIMLQEGHDIEHPKGIEPSTTS
ncbi:conserved hypothetical protein [Histoplasma capsulatum H143]|uniref:Uncharacterized protein n=1 Tax=Ajellomyces capsulatus (strain H143) TaxID=544712 RepID=C6HQX9_AJECH|nr:conserved hypothetical protein [Histoplasma capsulatum H143]